MIRIAFGPQRAKLMKWTGVYIPDPSGSPTEIRRFVESARESKELILIATQNSMVLDAAIPDELILFGGDETAYICMDDVAEFRSAFDAGIQHVSEILKSHGWWE